MNNLTIEEAATIINKLENSLVLYEEIPQNSFCYVIEYFDLDTKPKTLYSALSQGIVYKVENNKIYIWHTNPGEHKPESWVELFKYKMLSDFRILFILKKF